MCDATDDTMRGPVRCVVDWPHRIHCGFVGRTRYRWTSDRTTPTADELREWDEALARRMSELQSMMQAK